jgi:4-hydroxybenzoate polyprenyltransferase
LWGTNITAMTEYRSVSMTMIIRSYYRYGSKIAKQMLSLLSVSSLFIGFTGFFRTYIAGLLMGMEPSISACFVVFLTTFSIYSLDSIVDMDKDITNMPERKKFLSKRKRLYLLCSVAAYLLAGLILLLSKPFALPIIFLPFAANAFYATKLPVLNFRLKDIPFVKNFVVAVAWGLTCTLLPAAYMVYPPEVKILRTVFYFMLVTTFIAAVLYDVRDVKGDREIGVRTIPVILGAGKTTGILLVLNSTLLPLLALVNGEIQLLMAGLILYGYVYIPYFRERRDPIILDLFVDGKCIFATLLFVAFHNLL